MADRIVLSGLRVRGHHGVLPEERRDGQEFVIDVELTVDTRDAAASDDLADTADYGALATRIEEVVAGEPVNLIETLAARLADLCVRHPRVIAARVTVHKPHAPVALPFDDISVTVERP
jgi:dihydroneopterin aldolase